MEFGLVIVWLAVVLGLGLLALPFTAWLFPRGDHGAYAITVAVASVGVVAHLVGHLSYRVVALLAGLIGLIGLSWLTFRRVEIDRKSSIEALVVFTVTFLFIVVIRAIEPSAGTNPHWVGEMFLDFGLLNSLEVADALPPEDMWFAGETVRYHYGGHLLTSLLAGLTLTPPAYAYNLGLATFYGMLATMAWGLTRSITRPMAVSSRLAGILGVFFVAFAGNLLTALRSVVWLLPDSLAEALVSFVITDVNLRESVFTWRPGDFFYWDSSRVITREITPATEFPLFSWLHGDLHGHVLVKPLLLLVLAIGVAYWYTPPSARIRRLLLLFGVLPPLVGLIAVVNIWSVPIVVGLLAVFIVFAPGHPADLIRPGTAQPISAFLERRVPADVSGAVHIRGLLSEVIRIVIAVGLAIVGFALAIIWSLPYWVLVVLRGPGESITTWDTGTPLGSFLVVQGAFVVGFLVYVGARLTLDRDRFIAVSMGLLAIFIVLAVGGWGVIGAIGALLLVAWWFMRRDRDIGETDSVRDTDASFGPEAMLLIAGLGIVLIVEVFKLEGDSFNSVFKPYADIWQLWAVALAVVSVRLIDGWPFSMPDSDRSGWSTVALVFVIILVVSTGLYGVLALPAHVEHGNSWSDATTQVQDAHGYTLDATAYIDVLYEEEAPAIAYLNDLEGQPTILTAVPSGYWWRPFRGDGAAAPASLTRASTVLGWAHHQRQYRGSQAYDDRYMDVVELYTSDDVEAQQELLERYEVDYVYIGPAERVTWQRISIDEHPALEVAVEFESVTIYRVNLDY